VTAQELQGAKDADAGHAEYLDKQWRVFKEREGELLARHPDKSIAVCEEEVFVGDDDDDAVSKVEAAHPGMPFFLRASRVIRDVPGNHGGAGDNVLRGDAAFEEDLSRQKRIFMDRADELLARHPYEFIAVCGGDVFVGKDDDEAISKAQAAHPGRPFFLRIYDPCSGY